MELVLTFLVHVHPDA